MVAFKQDIRDRELWDADVKIEDEKVVQLTKIDNDAFFASDSESVHEAVERRPVMRDGRVPKMAKNFEKIQQEKIEKQRRAEGWYDDPIPEEVPQPKVAYRDQSSLAQKPLKIKASSYGKDMTAQNARNMETAQPAGKMNVKF